jgi:hypothetical protein
MLKKRTWNLALLVVGFGTLVLGLVRAVPVAGQDDTQTKIDNAMSAAPASIADHATILDNAVDDAGKFVVLREGNNGWYCLPDALGTPGPDPWCFDDMWLEWTYAFMAGKEPNTTEPGLAYMLQGGSDASNTDPFATEPEAGNEWMNSPAHMMLLMPDDLAASGFSPDYTQGGPWIMWAGTPYEHLMMPVGEGEMAAMGEMAAATPAA